MCTIISGTVNLWLTSSISYRLLSQALLPPTVTQNDVFVYASSHRFFSVWHQASYFSLCVMVCKWDVKDWQIKWRCRVKVFFFFLMSTLLRTCVSRWRPLSDSVSPLTSVHMLCCREQIWHLKYKSVTWHFLLFFFSLRLQTNSPHLLEVWKIT